MPSPSASIEDPPYDRNGRVMPLVGIRCRVEAMLIAACSPNWIEQAGRREQDEEAAFLRHPRKPAQHDEREQRDDDEADDHSELFPGDGEDKIGMRVGEDVLHRAFARTAAPQPAIGKSLDRAVHLIAVAGRGIEEVVDPDPDMRQVHIGADQSAEPGESARRNPVKPHPGHEELRKPDGRDDRRHADVRLLYQHREDDEEQRDANQIAGKARAQLLLRKQPRGDDGEGRLDEFGGLQRQAREIDPAPRALDLDADDESQREQGERDAETDHRNAADGPGRLQRDREHEAQRQRQHRQMAADKMQPVITDPLGHRRARRQAHHDAEADQHAERGKAPTVDGPPPPRNRALIDPREISLAALAAGSPHPPADAGPLPLPRRGRGDLMQRSFSPPGEGLSEH